MPLIKGKSQKSFVKNLKTEMEHGKPQKQSLAIAYSMKRKAEKKKMADGGEVPKPSPTPSTQTNDPHTLGVIKSMASGFGKAHGGMMNCPSCGYAHGGQITDNYQSSGKPEVNGMVGSNQASGFVDHEGDVKRPNHSAMSEDERKLNQHGEIELGPEDGGGFHDETYMGRVNDPHDEYQPEEPGTDLVGRVMAQRQKRFSEGGRVANDVGTGQEADKMPNQFDDLVLRDDLESTYGDDDNSGDALGNEGEDERRSDIVARIMASRKKKDRNPRPA